MNPAISIIMPVFNSASYLKKAIQCIMNKVFQRELILMDDGSTDGSSEICDEYAEKDERIIVFHQNNQGMCVARNKAIDLARGKYIAFMDNDDSCKKDMLEKSYEAAEKYGADLVKFGREAIVIDKSGKIYERQERKLDFSEYDRDGIRKNFITLRKKGVFSPVWDGLYKKELILQNNILFDETLRYGEEDTIFCMQAVSVAEKLVLIPGIYYIHYIRLSHSASTKITDKALEKYFVSLQVMKTVMEKLKIDYVQDANVFDCFLQSYVIEFVLKLNYGRSSLRENKEWIRRLNRQIIFKYNIRFLVKMFRVSGKRSLLGLLWMSKRYMVLYYLVRLYFHKKIEYMR